MLKAIHDALNCRGGGYTVVCGGGGPGKRRELSVTRDGGRTERGKWKGNIQKVDVEGRRLYYLCSLVPSSCPQFLPYLPSFPLDPLIPILLVLFLLNPPVLPSPLTQHLSALSYPPLIFSFLCI